MRRDKDGEFEELGSTGKIGGNGYGRLQYILSPIHYHESQRHVRKALASETKQSGKFEELGNKVRGIEAKILPASQPASLRRGRRKGRWTEGCTRVVPGTRGVHTSLRVDKKGKKYMRQKTQISH